MKKIIITIDDDGRFVDISIEEDEVKDEEIDEVIERDTNKDITDYSIYARVWDDGCIGWSRDSECNLTFLKTQQVYANELLKAKGYLFLNDVYDMLGIPRTKAGQVVGWVYNEENPSGDNYVDFGIFDINNIRNREFINGYANVIILDFNVDGNILDLI